MARAIIYSAISSGAAFIGLVFLVMSWIGFDTRVDAALAWSISAMVGIHAHDYAYRHKKRR